MINKFQLFLLVSILFFSCESEYNKGYNNGYQIGNEEGYDNGYEIGNEEGYDYGYRLGKQRGYDEGYQEGIDEAKYCWDCGQYIY